MTATWLALYASCLCTEVAGDPAALPEVCPCHRRRMAVPPVPEQRGYAPMALGHRCTHPVTPPDHDTTDTDKEAQ